MPSVSPNGQQSAYPQSTLLNLEQGLDFKSFLKEVRLEDLNLNHIQEGILHISVPLKSGMHSFPGKYEKAAELKVKRDTMAWVTLRLAKDEAGDTVISRANIEISPPLKVKNPSSAFEEPGGANSFKDIFVDIIIRGVELGHEGEILFQGEIKKGPFREDIKSSFKPEMFPKVDLKIESLRHRDVNFDGIPVGDLLKQMGALLGEAKCSLKLRTTLPRISLPKHGIHVESNAGHLEASAHTRITFGDSKGIHMTQDERFQSRCQLGKSKVLAKPDLYISGFEKKEAVVKGEIQIKAKPRRLLLKVTGEQGLLVPMVAGGSKNTVRAKIKLADNKPLVKHARYNVNLKTSDSKPIELRALDAQFEHAKAHIIGKQEKAEVRASLSHPRLEYHGLSTELKGDLTFKVRSKDLKSGRVNYKIKPDQLRPFSRTLDYRFHPNSKLALRPRNTGLSAFLDPIQQFLWEPGAVTDPKSPSVGALHSKAWREQAVLMTQAPISKKNRVQLLLDGVTSFPKRLEMIQNAKKTICLQTLIFKDDDTGMQTAHALVDAKKRGLDVYVIVDSVGNVDSPDDLVKDNKIYSLLRNNGVKLQTYNNSALLGVRKIMSVAKRTDGFEGLKGLNDFVNPQNSLSTLNMLTRIAEGDLMKDMSVEDRDQIKQGLMLIFGGTSKAALTITKLARLTPEEPLEFSEAIDMFRQMLRLNNRWHEKYLITDSREVVVGGMNIADEYMKGGSNEEVRVLRSQRPAWRDTDIWIEGEGAYEAQICFLKNWKIVSSESVEFEKPDFSNIQSNIELQMVQSRPSKGVFHPITNLKIEALKSLKPGEKAYEATAYFVPIGVLKAYTIALMDAAKRGVDVRIVTNSATSTDVPQVYRAAVVCCYRDLLEAGVRIFERTGDRTMHQKAASYAGKLGLIGSYNLDNRSGSLNSENLAVVHNEDFAKQVEDMLVADMAPDVAKEIKFEEVKSFPVMYELGSSAWAMLGDLM